MAQLNDEHLEVISRNKARRYEQLKKEREDVFNSSNLDPDTKNKMIEFAKNNSTHKLREVIKDFFSDKRQAMNIKLSKNLKIKLNDSGKGSGANFDYDFKIIVIDKTKKPYKNKIITRDDIIRINAPLNGRCVNKTIDDFIEWTFCYNSPLYIQYRNDPTKHWNIDKQQWDNVGRQVMSYKPRLWKGYNKPKLWVKVYIPKWLLEYRGEQ